MKNKKDLAVIILIAFIITIILFILIFSGKGEKNKVSDLEYYKITFESKYGLKVKSIKALNQSQITLPVLEYEDYEFEGWTLDGVIVPNNFTINKDITLVAKWAGETTTTYTITFDTDGGIKISDMTLFEGDELNLPNNPTKKGYKFSHWEDQNNNKVTDKMVVKENINLKAIWEKDESKTDDEKEKDENKPDSKDEKEKDVYICDAGYELNGTKCTKTVKATSEKKCPDGSESDASTSKCIFKNGQKIEICQDNNAVGPDNNGSCYSNLTDEYDDTDCEDNNYYLYNNKCYKNSSKNTTSSCESGYELKNGNCIKIVDEELVYSCNQGILDKDQCVITINATKKNG